MRSKIIVGIASCAIIIILLTHDAQQSRPAITEAPQDLMASKSTESISGFPIRLKISGINVDADIEYVGLAPDGTMGIPKSQDTVAWFEPGTRPGASGSAVIAGHYGRKNGKGSVFDNLHKLRKGDKLYVEDSLGTIISFVVSSSRSYDPDADASDVFGSTDGKSHLNLITCEGAWDEASKSYSKRLIVFADKELE